MQLFLYGVYVVMLKDENESFINNFFLIAQQRSLSKTKDGCAKKLKDLLKNMTDSNDRENFLESLKKRNGITTKPKGKKSEAGKIIQLKNRGKYAPRIIIDETSTEIIRIFHSHNEYEERLNNS